MDKRQIDKLLISISCGDNDAFARLYDGTKRGVFSFLYSYYKRYEDTEDAMQSVYLKIKQNIHSYRHGTDGIAWILQIAKNFAINEINRNRRIVFSDTQAGQDEAPSVFGITEIMGEVLSDEERYIVDLHVLWGYKHREIAGLLHCPTGTVTSKYKRSIEKLRAALKEGDK